MASMLENQNQMTSAISSIQLAVAGVAGAVAEGVATNQIVASSTLKKHQKETAETESAITASGRTPTVQTPTDFQAKIQETINDASEVSIQAKTTGFINQSVSSSIEKTFQYTTDFIGGSAAAKFVKDKWGEMIKSKVEKPDDATEAAKTKADVVKKKITLLGPL
jgi:hypothetical protein